MLQVLTARVVGNIYLNGRLTRRIHEYFRPPHHPFGWVSKCHSPRSSTVCGSGAGIGAAIAIVASAFTEVKYVERNYTVVKYNTRSKV